VLEVGRVLDFVVVVRQVVWGECDWHAAYELVHYVCNRFGVRGRLAYHAPVRQHYHWHFLDPSAHKFVLVLYEHVLQFNVSMVHVQLVQHEQGLVHRLKKLFEH